MKNQILFFTYPSIFIGPKRKTIIVRYNDVKIGKTKKICFFLNLFILDVSITVLFLQYPLCFLAQKYKEMET